MMRLADYVADTLCRHGIRHVFMVTGGGAMHLNDAFGRSPGLEVVCAHHEQACAMAAESYARLDGKIAVVNVTTGPGGVNAINGVYGAWTDSIPMLVISGQVKRETMLGTHGLAGRLRQLGDQEIDIVGMVRGITKYSVTVEDPNTIRYHLERALHLASNGRPGPCWIDIPSDVQGAKIDPDALEGFSVEASPEVPKQDIQKICGEIYQRVQSARRPVVFVGNGVRVSGSQEKLLKLLEHWQVPVVTGWNAHDLVYDGHPCFAGRPGTVGDRPGNFAVQTADLLLVLGSRLNIRQVSYNWKSFASSAFKIMVDIDAEELKKPTLDINMPLHADVRDILDGLLALPSISQNPLRTKWLARCRSWREKYPVVLPEYWKLEDTVNPYCFVSALFNQLSGEDVVVCGDGTACVVTFQAANLKPRQRLYTNSGSASMGYDLPAAIGAAICRKGKRIICLAGDGSIQMNIQELQTIRTHHLPVKIFVLNNRGYHSIRQTQQNFFPDNIVGCGEESGLGFPDFEKLAAVYDMPYLRISNHGELKETLARALALEGSLICEILLDLNQPFSPKLASKVLPDGRIISPSLEDLAPFLSREELEENMNNLP